MTEIIEHRNLGTFKSSDFIVEPKTTEITLDEVDSVDYCSEAARLNSFVNWPSPYVTPDRLAAAGFYYTGQGDKVKCFECLVEICDWLEGDNPMVDHQRWSGRCRFIRKIPCGNIPIGVDPSTLPPPIPRGQDACGPYGFDYRPTAGPDTQIFSTDLQLQNVAALNCNGIIHAAKGPAHAEYASYDARLRTFETWPKSMAQTKEQLADAGFYYTGQGDQTICYHCGGGLKAWEREDDPWTEHAKHFSKCCYLLLVKGREYVNKITGQRPTPPLEQETIQTGLPSTSEKIEQPAPAEPQKKDENPGDSKPIDDPRLCKICYNEELGAVFQPCGHFVACVKCAPGMTICPLCREPVTMRLRAFFFLVIKNTCIGGKLVNRNVLIN